MKILLKFKDGMTVQSVADEGNLEGLEDFLLKKLVEFQNSSTISINDGQLERNCKELYSVEVLLDSYPENSNFISLKTSELPLINESNSEKEGT